MFLGCLIPFAIVLITLSEILFRERAIIIVAYNRSFMRNRKIFLVVCSCEMKSCNIRLKRDYPILLLRNDGLWREARQVGSEGRRHIYMG